MCGICGFNWPDKTLVRTMASKMEHRGPDSSGFIVDDSVSIGFRRLAIIDLSKRGSQPIFNSDNTLSIVFNGEVYNFKELKADLENKGHRFNSDTDTEVILHCYEEYGPACLRKLNGMFALCIYDSKKKELFIARDRLGIKPLYYHFSKGKLVFASEIKAILAHPIRREVDRDALNPFLKFKFVPGPATMFRGIKKLQPGHYMTFSLKKGAKPEIRKYWDLEFKEERKTESFYLDSLSQALETSVQRRLISDVPLGVFLSGGLDSSLITAMMAKHEKDIKTFSVGFEIGKHNEIKHARRVSEEFSTKHHELMVQGFDVEKLLPQIAYHLDEPVADWAAIPTYQISKLARKKVTVALAGDGGDEVFVGYRQSILNHHHRKVRAIPGILTSRLSPSNKIRRAVDISSISDPVERASSWLTVFNPAQRKSLLKSSPEPIPAYDAYRDSMKQLSPLNQNLYFETKTWLPDDLLVKIDKTTMMTSLEARVPFLDHELVELAAKVPTQMKLSGLTTKYLLKRIAREHLPKDIVNRKKHGFTLPLDEWFRGELKDYAEEHVLSKGMLQHLDGPYLKKILSMHQRGAADFGFHISSLISLSLWHEIFFDSGGSG